MAHNCFIYETLSPVNEMKMTNEGGLMTLSGVFGVCGVRNNNKRVYEKSNYAKCVKEMQQRIAENKGIPGELEHPQTMNITLENVSHKITKIDINEDGVVTGEIQLLNTPKGKIAQAIVEGGLPLFVSSRAMGQVDKAGNVTLENISSFDLVGTPGFSQAKMHLNESQVCESLGENTWYVAEKSDVDDINEDATPEPTKTIEENMSQELEEKIAALESRIEELESQLETVSEEAEAKQIDLEKLANGIQKWIVEEYSANLQTWIEGELVPHIIKESATDFANNIAPKIQNWIVEEFAPELEKWVVEQYSPEVEKWVIDQVAPGLQDWIIEEFAPQVEGWMNESYMSKISDKIAESLKDNKESKLKSISETLALIEGMDPVKPVFKGRQVNEAQVNEPAYIANMPEEYRPKYNMASQEVKEAIDRRAKVVDFNAEGALQRFWESIDWEEIKPVQAPTIDDQRERMIRESFRRRRNNVIL